MNIVAGGLTTVAEETENEDLLAQAAAKEGVPVEVLRDLLNLESEFPDLNVWGAKTEFARRVARILNTAAQAGAAP